MKTNISEDLPSRKFSPAAAAGGSESSSAAAGPGRQNLEKKARAAVSDVKYQVRKSMMGPDTKLDPAAFNRAVLQRIDKSEYSQPVKARARQIVLGDSRKSDVKECASDSVANALYSVFVEKKVDVIDEEYIEELKAGYIKKEIGRVNKVAGERSYKWKVTDKKTGNSYTRWATRSKANELRANPNIESIEMIDLYGSPEPTNSEKNRGAQTSSVTAGKGLKNDGNLANNYPPYDKVTRGDVIAGATGKDQMGGKRKVKEEFVFEAGSKKKDDRKKIDVMKGTNSKCIKIAPVEGGSKSLVAHNELEGEVISETGYSRFLHMFNEKMNLATADMGDVVKDFQGSDAPQFKGKSKKERQKMAVAAKLEAERESGMREEMECGSDDKKKKRDTRGDDTKINMIKNKFRAMGVKNPIVMAASYEPEGENIDEIAPLLVKGALVAGGLYAASKAGEALKKKVDAKIDGARKDWKIGGDRRVPQMNSYEPEGEQIDEEMPKRAKGKSPSGTRTFTGMGYYGRPEKEKRDPESMKPIFPEPKKSKPRVDDENPPRRRYRGDDHPSLSARERNLK